MHVYRAVGDGSFGERNTYWGNDFQRTGYFGVAVGACGDDSFVLASSGYTKLYAGEVTVPPPGPGDQG